MILSFITVFLLLNLHVKLPNLSKSNSHLLNDFAYAPSDQYLVIAQLPLFCKILSQNQLPVCLFQGIVHNVASVGGPSNTANSLELLLSAEVQLLNSFRKIHFQTVFLPSFKLLAILIFLHSQGVATAKPQLTV